MRRRDLEKWVFLLIVGCNLVGGIDFSSEKDYDSEIEDELDEIHDLEEYDASANRAFSGNIAERGDTLDTLKELLMSDRRLEEGVFEDDSDKEEEFNELEEHFLDQFHEDIERRGLTIRISNILHNARKKYRISGTNGIGGGACDKFRGGSHVTRRCKTMHTDLGSAKTCRITCGSGYHLKHPVPHYELCGAPTRWRWTYQLRGDLSAGESCVKGPVKKSLPVACTDSYCVSTAAYYMNKIDYKVNPCDNFFDYACGSWIKDTSFPPDSRGRVLTYTVLRRRVKKDMAELLAAPIKKTDISSIQKAKTIYESCINTGLIDKLDSKPLLNILKGEMTWPVLSKTWKSSDFSLEATLAALRGQYHNNILFKIRVGKSFGNYALQTWKGKTALPHQYYIQRQYYNRRIAYFTLMRDAAKMVGANGYIASYDMTKVLDFETEISLLKVLDQDYWSQKTISQMNSDLPGIDWLKLFKLMIKTAPVSSDTVVQVWNVNYLRDLINLINKTDKRIVQNYMIWRFVKHRLNNLSRRFQERYLEYEKALVGRRALHKRWYFCSIYLIFGMKGPTGKMFVDKYFSPGKKATAEEMFKNIRNAFIYLLDTEVDWMDNKTKAYAKEKARYILPFVGYNPHIYENITYLNNQWKELVARKRDYFGNVIRVLGQLSQNEFKKLTETYKPFFRGTSSTRPTMVNAFYSPGHNTITLPAGEMQYPFYWGDKYPKMFQYGGIGTILGHEITHGFDNNGALRDKYGRSRNWWSTDSLKEFHKRTACMANQYSNYFWKVAGKYLNGWKTLGENIADNGGIRESYFGYKIWLKSQNLTGEDIEPATGLTNDQMFFVGFANVRCAKYKKRAAEHYVVTSVHSPGRFRVIGSLQNFEKFSEAFHCPKTSYMNPKKKCVIW